MRCAAHQVTPKRRIQAVQVHGPRLRWCTRSARPSRTKPMRNWRPDRSATPSSWFAAAVRAHHGMRWWLCLLSLGARKPTTVADCASPARRNSAASYGVLQGTDQRFGSQCALHQGSPGRLLHGSQSHRFALDPRERHHGQPGALSLRVNNVSSPLSPARKDPPAPTSNFSAPSASKRPPGRCVEPKRASASTRHLLH